MSNALEKNWQRKGSHIAHWKLTLNESGSGAPAASNVFLNSTAPISISKLAATTGSSFL